MKKVIIAALFACFAAVSLQAQNIKIVTVAMDKVYDGYYKAQEGAKKIQSAFETAQLQSESFIEEGRKLVEERNKAAEDLQNPALSDQAKSDIQVRIRSMEQNIRQKEMEFQSWQRDTAGQLQQRQQAFRNEMIEEIKKVVISVGKGLNATLVFDTSDIINSGVPPVLYADASLDITDSVLKELNKDKPNN